MLVLSFAILGAGCLALICALHFRLAYALKKAGIEYKMEIADWALVGFGLVALIAPIFIARADIQSGAKSQTLVATASPEPEKKSSDESDKDHKSVKPKDAPQHSSQSADQSHTPETEGHSSS